MHTAPWPTWFPQQACSHQRSPPAWGQRTPGVMRGRAGPPESKCGPRDKPEWKLRPQQPSPRDTCQARVQNKPGCGGEGAAPGPLGKQLRPGVLGSHLERGGLSCPGFSLSQEAELGGACRVCQANKRIQREAVRRGRSLSCRGGRAGETGGERARHRESKLRKPTAPGGRLSRTRQGRQTDMSAETPPPAPPRGKIYIPLCT